MAAAADKKRGALAKAVRLIGIQRSVVTVLLIVLAVFAARFSWQAPLVIDIERALFDLRVWALTPQVARDPRIVLVTYTDDTLEATGRRSPLDRGLLARALTNLDALRPRSVGVDILIDQPQPEDGALRDALHGMATPTYLAFARSATNSASMQDWQEAYERRFQAGIGNPRVHPASIRLEADKDGVIRSWAHPQPGDPPSLAERMVSTTAQRSAPADGSIEFAQAKGDLSLFDEIPIDLFDTPFGAQAVRDRIAGKHVLIGGDISDVDRFDTPATRMTAQPITGLAVHAMLLRQLLDGAAEPRLSSLARWALAIGVVLVGATTGFRELGRWGAPAVTVELALIIALPFGLQAAGVDTQFVPAFGWLVGWMIAWSSASAAARGVGSTQRRFAQSALGKYLPPEIAREIMRDPERLSLSGERRAIYAVFSDIEGFTRMTHEIPPERTADLLNRYLDMMSDIILARGGTIDKFVGDAVVAFWGAPLAHANDGEMALLTALSMADAGDSFSRVAATEGVHLGRTRVGLHHGDAIVGNFGGDDRVQYTALGDVMNCAARLEGANKTLKTRLLVSAEAAQGMTSVPLRPMGRVAVRGRSTPITVFEPCRTATPVDIGEVTTLITAFDTGKPGAVPALDAFAAAHHDDAAIQNLVYRLKQAGPGGYYALD